MKIYKILIFLLLSYKTFCNYAILSEELVLKENIILSPKIENIEKFMDRYSYSIFSYYIIDKFNVNKIYLKKYKIKYYKPKIYNKFIILKKLKKKFYSTLDKKLALEIANIYKEYKKYNRAEIFYLFSECNKLPNAINKEAFLEEAHIFFQNKNFSEAKIYYKKLLMYPESLSKKNYKTIFLKLGEIEFFQSNFISSIDYLMKAKKILKVEEKISCIYYLALCYYKIKEHEKALKYFRKIEELYPFTKWEKKALIYIDNIKSEVQYNEQ